MNYYNTDKMLGMLKYAFKGNEEAKAEIASITVPYTVSHDYSVLILVQEKHALVNDKGMVQVLDMPPEVGKRRRHADIYQCTESAAVWTSIPIPYNFIVYKMEYIEGLFSFISTDNRLVRGTLAQIKHAMHKVVFAIDGASEIEIENCFFSIPSTVLKVIAPKKTIAENLSIKDELIGTLIFDEHLQQYKGSYQVNGYPFELFINIDSYNEVVLILPIVREVLTHIKAVDLKVRAFAANELLELKKKYWMNDAEECPTKNNFISRMSIETISFDPDGVFQIWYNDGNLFWGHSITVHIKNDGEPEKAEING